MHGEAFYDLHIAQEKNVVIVVLRGMIVYHQESLAGLAFSNCEHSLQVYLLFVKYIYCNKGTL